MLIVLSYCREIEKREKHYMPSIRVWSSDNPLPQIEYMDSLWLQIKNMRNNNWEVRMHGNYQIISNVLEKFERPAEIISEFHSKSRQFLTFS
jgi:hypothetical protein